MLNWLIYDSLSKKKIDTRLEFAGNTASNLMLTNEEQYLRSLIENDVIFLFAVNGAVFDKEAAVIECGSQFTTITLDRAKYPWFNPERMRVHLNNPVCEPSFVNTTHVRFNMPLGGCGSRHITSPRKVIFTNRVFFVEEGYHHGYSEKETKTLMEIYFLCKYRRTDFLSERLSQKRKRLL